MGVHDGHRKRLKTQFLIHGEDFHDHQLLELLLCYAIPQGDVNGFVPPCVKGALEAKFAE